MQNNFSKCREWVPRGTSQHKWRWLTTLLLILTLGIGQMWGTATNFHDFVAAGDTIIDLEGSGSTPSAKFTAVNNTDWASVSTSAKNASVKRIDPSTGATAANKSNVYGTKLSSSNKTILKVQGVTGVSYYIGGSSSRKGYLNVEADGGDKWAQMESSELSTNCAVMTCTLDKDSSYTLTLSASSDIFCYAIKITVASKCNDPGTALSLSSDAAATIYVGDEITFSTTGGNGGAVTIAGAASETITANKWTATEGTHTFTASQAKNGDYCAQEDELELTVIAATPVASVTVSGPANAYKNTEVEFTATAANATDYRWKVDGTVQVGASTNEFAFTPTESKTYSIVCEAKNAFNSDWVASSAHSLTVTSLYGELIRATLTGGNNATMTGIIGGTFDSNLGSGKYKLDKNVYMGVQLASGSFQEGDTVIVSMTTAGSNYPCLFADKERNTLLYLATETSSALVYKMVLPAAANNKNTVYLSRDNDVTYKWNPVVAYISVVRPMPVKSSVESLTGVTVGGTAISPANLATLLADYSLALSDEFAAAPTVVFAKHIVNTYEDDSQKAVDTNIEVVATEITGNKWQAQATINSVTYTVTTGIATSFTVNYVDEDGTTPLGSENVAVGEHPTASGITTGKNYYTFAGWLLNDVATTLDAVSASAGQTVTLKASYSPAYATSINIEQWVLANGTTNSTFRAELTARHYKYANLNNLDTLNDDPNKDYRNYAYLGQKVNKTDSEISFLLKTGSTLNVRFGHIGTPLNVVIGSAEPVELTSAEYANDAPGDKKYTYTATEDVIVKFQTTGTSTCVFKQIMIDEEIAAVTLPAIVTLDANGGTYADASVNYTGTPLVIGDATPADEYYIFAGWYDGENQINATAYVPTKNVTLQAHYAPAEYAVNYAAGDHGSGSMSADAAGWGTEYTAVANGFAAEEGYLFAGWTVTGVDGVSTISNLGSFTMPKNDVTLTAIWEDNSKVAKIGDAKYTTLEAALADAANGTIELLRDIDVTAQVEIAAGVTATIDLAGHKIEYTGTSTLPSGVILVHNGASLTIDDSSDPDAGSIVSGEKAYAAIALTKAGDDAANPAILVINGGIFTGYYYAITGNGSRHNTQITINGGVITATATNDNLAIYHPQAGTLTVNGGTLTGYNTAIEMRAGELVINDGTFTATAPAFSCNPNGSGTTTVGAAIAIAQHTTKVDIAVTINGGEFNGVKAVNESNPQVNDPAPQVAMAITDGEFNGAVETVDVDHFISGGIFDNEVSNAQCAENYVPKDNGDGTYGVKPKDGAVIIGADMVDNGGTAVEGINPIGAYYGAVTAKLKNLKVNSSSYYIGLQLTAGQTFQKGDVLNLHTTTAATQGKIELYEEAAGTNLIWATDDAASAVGDNKIVLTDAVNGYNALYIVRKASSGDQSWNGYVDHVEVTRPMQPMLIAFSVDGRDGVIDEVNKTVAVNIPFEADLDNLTIVDEVLWNEAAATDAKVVTTNSGAWVESPETNTYRLTDKDGDYTDYIITLTRDVLKHTVSYNVHGGSAVASEEVEHGAYLAAAPAEPTKEDYLFQGWAETADGAIVDVTTFAITADKEFHAVWASDGAIKLLDGEGNINTTNFITGVTATTVTFNEVEHNAAAWGGTQGAISGTNQMNKIVQYNATTNRTKIKVSVYNTNNSPKQVYLHKILEGETTAVVETLAVASKGNAAVESEYYEFNSDANRSFYLTTNSTDVKIVQVKVIESGDVTLKRAGEAGYELNLNKGRVLAYANTDINFEGLEFATSSNYGVISSTELQIKAPLAFTISSPVTLTLNNNSNKYQVSQSISGSGDEYAAGEQVLDLTTTGTWYIVPTTTSAVKLTSIAFALPKCEAPVFGTMEDIELCATEAIPAIDGTATVSDGGDVTYKWYAEGDAETVLATTATYTPAADGSFYVVATNSLAGHQDVSATSVVVKVSHFASVAITTAPEDVYKHAGLDAELSVVAEGKNVTYEWFTCDDELGTNHVAIVPAETGASLNLTAIEAGIKYYQVVVTDECGTTASAVAKVEGFNDIALVDVTGDMFWDFSKANDGTAAGSNLCNEAVLVNVSGIVNNSDFKSDNIKATANKFSSGKLQASMIMFHTTVPGAVIVKCSHTGNNKPERYLMVNGVETELHSTNQTVQTYAEYVPAGDVVLTVGGDGNMFNFTSVEFKVDNDLEPARTDEWLAPGELGTVCIPQGAVAVGADIYELVGKDPQTGKIVFETVEHMKPGKPYLFQSKSTRIDFILTDEAEADEPDNSGAMKGTFVNLDLTELENVYYFAGHALWSCVDLTSLSVPANRAYVKLDEVETLQSPNPAPGRRRITLGVNGQNTATGLENLVGGEQAQKLMINGQMYILRGEKLYDATGRLVK